MSPPEHLASTVTTSRSGHIKVMSLVSADVRAFADALLRLPDAALLQDWSGAPGPIGWQDYSDTLSDIVFSVYQRLRDFTVTVHANRTAGGPTITTAHRILAQHQLAYCDFLGGR